MRFRTAAIHLNSEEYEDGNYTLGDTVGVSVNGEPEQSMQIVRLDFLPSEQDCIRIHLE